jgi:hypothetical protein
MIKIDENLAEETGIHIGDGMMNHYPDCRLYYIKYVGNIEEMNSYGKYIIHLLKKVYNPKHIRKIIVKGTNYYYINVNSKEILLFKKDVLGLPLGPKGNMSIPHQILNSTNLFIPFLRGLFDTDGSIWFERRKKKIHYYPKIKIELKSKNIILQCLNKLRELEFNVSASFDLIQTKKGKRFKTHRIVINGVKSLEKWWSLIGSKNPKNITKYLIWKKFGFCPPYTTLEQRQKILKGEINVNNF